MKHRFDVRDMCQTASGGSYIVKYSAVLLTSPGTGEVTVDVINTLPETVCDELLKQSLDEIRLGASEVLCEQQLNGMLTLEDLVIHDVDCKPYKFRGATSGAIRAIGTLT